MLIRQTIFYCELFCGLSSWLSARFPTLLMLVGIGALHHSTDDLLPTVSRTAWYCWSCNFFI